METTIGGIKMKFSVLIPVYNTEKYLEKCLQSVLNQTYQNFEIVIVDDGSTDNSSMICDKYRDIYSDKIIVIHKANQGLISARRVGIDNANGDYCIFVDSDDYIKENLLCELSRVLNKDETIDLLIYSFNYVQDNKIVKQFHRIEQDGAVWNDSNRKEIIEKLLYSNDVTPIWIKAVKTTFLKSDSTNYSQFYKKNMAEDYLQSLFLISNAKKIVFFYLPLYCYNYNDLSISRNFSAASIAKQNKLHVYYVLMEYLKDWKLDDSETKSRINARWFDDTMYQFFKCYENAKRKNDKRELLSFNWDSMLPSQDVDTFSKYANKEYCRVYQLWKNKKNKQIRQYFIKRYFYSKYKKVKNRLKK